MFKLLSVCIHIKKNQSVELINTNFQKDVNVAARSPSLPPLPLIPVSLSFSLTQSLSLSIKRSLVYFMGKYARASFFLFDTALHTQYARII